MMLSGRLSGPAPAASQRHQRSNVVANAATTTSSVRLRSLSQDFQAARRSMEEDEQLKVFMAGLRGSNIDDSDFASASSKMTLVEVRMSADDTEALPLDYQPDLIASYWSRRPVSVVTRLMQLIGTAGGFLGRLAFDAARGRLKETEVQRAIELRNTLTRLGPAYIKLGQALSIRPDILSPAAMNELQRLCDKVPSFDSALAMDVIKEELGAHWSEVYAELTPSPIAAASLGQVYKGRLHTGEKVAVKVQRPFVLETVTIDLFILRSLGLAIRQYFPDVTKRADLVALLDEWAARFFDELDYVKEGTNAIRFAEQMREELPQVVVPKTYLEYTSRRVLTTEWLEGEKLSQSKADDVGTLVNVGVICFLKQLLDTGFFHADPHPGNLIRTPDGRLAILDYGLMTEVDDSIKFGMIEAISHLIHRDYEAIVEDFVTLQFIPPGTDLRPILPVLAKVFDKALEGGGAKNINFQELAADLAEITFEYPFRIPPYFALIIRAIGVLEGIALVGNSDFAIVDEAYPYIARRLLTSDSPRLREALRYMIYGKEGVFDADRMVDLLEALEDFKVASSSARGDMDLVPLEAAPVTAGGVLSGPAGSSGRFSSTMPQDSSTSASGSAGVSGLNGWPLAVSIPIFGSIPVPGGAVGLSLLESTPMGRAVSSALLTAAGARPSSATSQTREALRFILSPEGQIFRQFVLDELVKSVDALSRTQAFLLAERLGLATLQVPVFLPGARRTFIPLVPSTTEEDRRQVDAVMRVVNFLTNGSTTSNSSSSSSTSRGEGRYQAEDLAALAVEAAPVAAELLPELVQRLSSRLAARLVREVYAA